MVLQPLLLLFLKLHVCFFLLEITLMEWDTFIDDFVGKPQIFNLSGLELDKVYQKTFVFREVQCFDCQLMRFFDKHCENKPYHPYKTIS